MKTPESAQAPDLMRLVSWLRVCCVKFLFAIVMAPAEVSFYIIRTLLGAKLALFAEKRNERAVRAPDNILYRRGGDLGKSLLLDVIQDDGRRRAENQACGAAVEDLVRLDQVANFDELFAPERAIGITRDGSRYRRTHLSRLVQHREPVPCHENRSLATLTLPIRRRVLHLPNRVLRECRELGEAVV